MSGPVDRQAIHAEMELARGTFQRLVATASPSELARRTAGTRWTNQQMLFHMLFGYLVVLSLLGLVRFFGRLPDRHSRRFARVLNAGTRPFHVVNYLGSCGGAMVFRGPRLAAKFDRTIAALHRHLDDETDETLSRRMHFPVDWDPYFRDTMTLLDVYHYGSQHYAFHARQLTLRPTSDSGPTRT
jgi:hypothetical protein